MSKVVKSQASFAIEVSDLTKEYGDLVAVDQISFTVSKGEIFGILGPNGAGKTTTLEMVEGLRKASSGKITVLGIESNSKTKTKVQKQIGIQLQSSSYFEHLNLKELVDLFASFYGEKVDVMRLLEKVELADKAKQFVKKLSGGQQQRFAIIAALVQNPQIVFLDEPTTGLDPKIRRDLWDLIREVNNDGKTVVLTTHYMEEAQQLCDRVAIMNEGKIVDIDSPQQLIDKQSLPIIVRFISQDSKQVDLKKMEQLKYVVSTGKGKRRYLIGIKEVRQVNDFLNYLESEKIQFTNLEVIPPSLEDVFLNLTGRKLNNS